MEEDDDYDDDEVDDQERSQSNVDEEDEDAPLRRAFFHSGDAPHRKSSGDSRHSRSRRVLLKPKSEGTRVSGFGEEAQPVFGTDRSDSAGNSARTTTHVTDDHEAEHATVALLYAEFLG